MLGLDLRARRISIELLLAAFRPTIPIELVALFGGYHDEEEARVWLGSIKGLVLIDDKVDPKKSRLYSQL